MNRVLFSVGRVFATPGALEALEETFDDVGEFLRRHQSGDWGECCAEDWQTNNDSVIKGYRILSVYRTKNNTKLWLITEADRSSSTFLLPEEY